MLFKFLSVQGCTFHSVQCQPLGALLCDPLPSSKGLKALNLIQSTGWLNSNHAPLLDSAHVFVHFNENQVSVETFSADNKKRIFAYLPIFR